MPRMAPPVRGQAGGLRPGDEVLLRTDVPVRAGVYRCRVLDVGSAQIRLSMPMLDGRVVVVPTGAAAELETADGARLRPRGVDRATAPARSSGLERPVPQADGGSARACAL